MQFAKLAAAVLIAAPIFGSGGNPTGNLTVHEWGTFTTVAGADGGSEPWSPLGGPSDLPCFVLHLHGVAYKWLPPGAELPPGTPITKPVTVRMETPVLYFYAPEKTEVSVGVDFPHGLITEWYPAASRVTPEANLSMPPVEKGHIEWDKLQIAPGEKPWLPHGTGASPYYAARETDSSPLRIGSQEEKLLFYRGIANFPVPLSARIEENGTVVLHNTGPEALSLAVVFENRAGKVGYRLLRDLRGEVRSVAPALTSNLAGLKSDLAAALVSQGLYRKEAEAMIATWSDSWFEEGLRVFYLVPRQVVDTELPLAVAPAPKTVERVFVGRVEMLSPYRREQLSTALASGDTVQLDRFGRFLAPFLRQVTYDSTRAVENYLAGKAKQAENEFYSPSCVR